MFSNRGRIRYTSGRMSLVDAAHARALFSAFGGWFGPPTLWLAGSPPVLLDGRKRSEAWHSLGFTSEPPKLIAPNRIEAARVLVLAQHPERARDMLGDAVSYDASIAALLRLPLEQVGPLLALTRRRAPRSASTERTARRRAQVVEDLRRLLADAEEGCTVGPDELRRTLGPFAEEGPTWHGEKDARSRSTHGSRASSPDGSSSRPTANT